MSIPESQHDNIITTSAGTWRWDASWPGVANAVANGVRISRTMGIAFSEARQQVFLFHEGEPSVIVCAVDGTYITAWGGHWPVAHGCTLVNDPDHGEVLWLTCRRPARVECYTLDGELLQTLPLPAHDAYPADKPNAYQPADVAVWDDHIWVADAYGKHLIHIFDKSGDYLKTLEEGPITSDLGKMANPHALRLDARPVRDGKPLMQVTDRGNKRLRWYHADGTLSHYVDDITHSPSSFAYVDNVVLIPEMFTGVKLVAGDDQVLADVGVNDEVITDKDLPEASLAQRYPLAKDAIPCAFPHGCCSTARGDFYFTDGVDEGRVTILRKQ